MDKNSLNKEAMQKTAHALSSFIHQELVKQSLLRNYTAKWIVQQKQEPQHIIILIGPRQCGKTTYLKMWKNKNKNKSIRIYDIEKIRNDVKFKIKNSKQENDFKELVKNKIASLRCETLVIENGTFKTNDEYIQLVKLFKENTKIDFHFWRDKECQFAKPDPTMIYLITGNNNITVKEHNNNNYVKPAQHNDWRRSKYNK